MRRLKVLLLGTLILWCNYLNAQGIITGKVLDALDKSALANVSVAVNGNVLTTTDKEGAFTLNAPLKSKLAFTFAGYQTLQIITDSTELFILLMPLDKTLKEIVITGYKKQAAREFSGSASHVKGERLKHMPIASFNQTLQGHVPGLLVRAQSGQPGASGSAIVRGRGSINGSSEPIYVVDGIQISATDFALFNPADIENITVLKDAVGAGIYGSRGGNGVIVVTTKNGRNEKASLGFEAYTGWSRFAAFRDLSVMNSNQKIDYELRRGGTVLAGYSAGRIDSLRNINTNWEDLITQTGRTYNVTGTVNGGNSKSNYYSSINYFKQEGTLRNTGFNRVTGRTNLAQEHKNIRLGINLSGAYAGFSNTGENNSNTASPLNGLQWANPYEQPFVPGRYDAAGNFVAGGNNLVRPRITQSAQPIPTTELFVNWNNTRQLRFTGSGHIEYSVPFIKGLSLKALYGIDYKADESRAFIDRTTFSAGNNPKPSTGNFANYRTSSFARDYFRTQRITNTNSINYSNQLGQHTVDVGAYYEYVQQKDAQSGNTVYLLSSPFQNEAGATINADLLPLVRANAGEGRLQSYFSALTYGFKKKYYLNANVRRDGSSRFGRDKQYATFGGLGLSWIISDEAFWQRMQNVVPALKFRISYGTVGNQEGITFYQAQGVISNRTYNNTQGTIQTGLQNPALQWEERKKFNTGVDYGLFKNRIYGSVDYYNETTGNLFLLKELSRTTGFNTIITNIGSVRNSGVEMQLTAAVINRRHLTLNIISNFTYNKNEILKLADRDSIVTGSLMRATGHPINSFFLVPYAGVNSDNGYAQYRKLDGSLTSDFRVGDKQVVGKADPHIFGGTGFNVQYKNFSAQTFFTYMLGSKLYNNERNNLENPNYLTDNLNADLLTEWRKPGDVTSIPRPDAGPDGKNVFQRQTTRFLENNSFVRLRDVMLAYRFPNKLTNIAKVEEASAYISGTNLWVKTPYRGRDPEFTETSLGGAQYPALRTVTIGFQFKF